MISGLSSQSGPLRTVFSARQFTAADMVLLRVEQFCKNASIAREKKHQKRKNDKRNECPLAGHAEQRERVDQVDQPDQGHSREKSKKHNECCTTKEAKGKVFHTKHERLSIVTLVEKSRKAGLFMVFKAFCSKCYGAGIVRMLSTASLGKSFVIKTSRDFFSDSTTSVRGVSGYSIC